MDKVAQARYRARADVFKALAHPTRLFIVDHLSRNTKCVKELAQMVGVDNSTLSRHLGVLKNAGIINDEKRGVEVYYKLKMPCVLDFFHCVESVIKCAAKDRSNLVD